MSVPLFFNDQSLPASSYEEGSRLLFGMTRELATLLDLFDRMDEEHEGESGHTAAADEGETEEGGEDHDEDDEADDELEKPAGCEWICESAFEYYMLTDTDLVARALADEEHLYGEYRDELNFLSRIDNMSPVLDNVAIHWSAILDEADVYFDGYKQEGWVAAAAAAVEGGVLASLNTRPPWNLEAVPLEVVWLNGDDLAAPAQFQAINLSCEGHADVAFKLLKARLQDLSLTNWSEILPGVRVHRRVLRWLRELSAAEPKLLRQILGHMSRAHRRRYKVDGRLVKPIVASQNLQLLEIRIRHFQSAVRMFLTMDPETKTPIYLFGGIKAQRQTSWYKRAKDTCKKRFQAFSQDPMVAEIP